MVEQSPLSEAIRATLPPVVVAYLAALEVSVATLTARVAELQARLGQTSSNSSRPPSRHPPGARPAPPAQPGRRRPGGQPGHRGAFRVRVPQAQVAHTVPYVPPACARCGAALPAVAGPDAPPDQCHQVVDLLPMQVQVTEHHLAARTCASCGHQTGAAWPAGVPRGVVGPPLAATVAVLTGRYRLSTREAAACLTDLCGVELAVGTISAVEQQVRAALEPVVAEARAAVQMATVVTIDETGWRQGRQRAWRWTVVTALGTVFHSDRSRGGQVARALLGEAWHGIVGAERFSAYRWLGVERRQVCWAHLTRDFQQLVDWGPGPRPAGERLLACQAHVFELWQRFRAGELERTALAVGIGRVAAEVHAVLAAATERGHPVAQALGGELLAVWPALWTFVVVAGVAPTTTVAEQALRAAVLWRKGSFGTHSDEGSRFVERMLPVRASCRTHGRSVIGFVVAALTAAHRGQPHPALLPPTNT